MASKALSKPKKVVMLQRNFQTDKGKSGKPKVFEALLSVLQERKDELKGGTPPGGPHDTENCGSAGLLNVALRDARRSKGLIPITWGRNTKIKDRKKEVDTMMTNRIDASKEEFYLRLTKDFHI